MHTSHEILIQPFVLQIVANKLCKLFTSQLFGQIACGYRHHLQQDGKLQLKGTIQVVFRLQQLRLSHLVRCIIYQINSS